jgi:anti-anti-sigma factor
MIMDVYIHKSDQHATIVEIKGELDMYSSSKLKKIMKSLWKKDRTPLILDLKDLMFIDSSGIGILLYFHNHMNERKQPFYLVNLNHPIQTAIKLTGIQDHLPIADDVNKALSLINQ